MNKPVMPELPEPIDVIVSGGQALRGYTADQMHAYARHYAAALEARLREVEKDAARYRWLRDDAGIGFVATLNMRRENCEWNGEIDAEMGVE